MQIALPFVSFGALVVGTLHGLNAFALAGADNPGIWMDHCHDLPHAAQEPHVQRRHHQVSSAARPATGPNDDPATGVQDGYR